MILQTHTVIAANRFGLGARPGELREIGNSPREWLKDQLSGGDPWVEDIGQLPSSEDALSGFLAFRNKTRMAMEQGKQQGANPRDVMNLRQTVRPMYQQHVMARSRQAIETKASFRERLVHFWSNHFAVSADEARLLGLVGTLEFEAIRPNVTGYFSDMLMAVETHPAMLVYLDNHQSVGPHSVLSIQAGRRNARRKFDINENLAREILELHTLGVDGGYTQEDVTGFAKVISGWSIGGMFPRLPRTGPLGAFYFNDLIHEPGNKKVLGKTYKQSGMEQGKAVLKDLALHPSTAKFLATKLARHFIADAPPERAVKQLQQAYLDSNGYLPAVYQALIDMEETWQTAQLKYKTPHEYVYSLFRAIAFDVERGRQLIGPLTVLGQQPFKPGSPAGWPDTAREWAGGEALMKRVELASTVGNNIGNGINPEWLASEILGPTLSDHTRTEILRAESGAQGLALLFASPEFQRR